MTLLPGEPCSPSDVARTEIELPDRWWGELRRLAAAPTTRSAVTQTRVNGLVRRAFGRHRNLQINRWETVHGDLHWNNLLQPQLGILDWELWGQGPAGTDVSTLYCYSLLNPDMAHRVHSEFADVLDSSDGTIAQLWVAAHLLKRIKNSGDFPDLEQPQAASWPALVADILEAGSSQAVWQARHQQSLFDGDMPEPIVEAGRRIAGWQAAGLGFHTFRDGSYPAQLREIHQLPPVLFSRGALEPGETAVSVVGSRRASEAGLAWARQLAKALAASGITVISGLAAGIDTAAHTAALDAGGRTVAVLGTGINRTYPAANRDLQERIARDGLLLSQFWPDAPPTKKSFPLRNATMSGYGRATVVVEAGDHSGARIQARVGIEHGRPVILTDSVVRNNEWARALRHRPGVHVASTPDDVLRLVHELSQLDDVLIGLLAPRG